MELEIRPAVSSADFEQVRSLYLAYADWQRQTYHDVLYLLEDFFQSVEVEGAALPGVYAPPEGCLLLARIDGASAGTVALKKYSDTTCEMMRMFVAGEFQGRGVGRELVVRLREEASGLGYSSMLLVTGPRQMAAQKLYTRSGFQVMSSYGDMDIPQDLIAQLPADIQGGPIYMQQQL